MIGRLTTWDGSNEDYPSFASDSRMLGLSNIEHLANEILLDIFDYLQAIDVLRAFSILNYRLEFLLLKSRMHVDLSTNVSLSDFSDYCSNTFGQYASSIHSIRLSNIETCGGIQLFLSHFPSIEQTFPHLSTMSFDEPTDEEFKQIVQFEQLTSISVKFSKHNDPQIPIGLVFTMPALITYECCLWCCRSLLVGSLQMPSVLRWCFPRWETAQQCFPSTISSRWFLSQRSSFTLAFLSVTWASQYSSSARQFSRLPSTLSSPDFNAEGPSVELFLYRTTWIHRPSSRFLSGSASFQPYGDRRWFSQCGAMVSHARSLETPTRALLGH